MRTRKLCVACAARETMNLNGTGLTLAMLVRGRDQKVDCEGCGRRKYGAVYEIRRDGK